MREQSRDGHQNPQFNFWSGVGPISFSGTRCNLINYPTLEILRQMGGGLSIFTSWNHNLPTYKGFQLSGMLMPTSHLKNFLNASPSLTLKSYAIWLLHLGCFINIALEYYDALPQPMCFYQPLNLSWPMYSKYLQLYVTIHVFLCFAVFTYKKLNFKNQM